MHVQCGIEYLEEKNSTNLVNFEDKKLSFMTIELSNRIAIVDEISTGGYTADTNVQIINPTTKTERCYMTENIQNQ